MRESPIFATESDPCCFENNTFIMHCDNIPNKIVAAFMCRLQNIAMRDYHEIVTIRQTDRQTDAGQSDPYLLLCFAGDTKTCNFAIQTIQ